METLEHVLQYEKDHNTFCPDLPHRHAEIARALLDVSSDTAIDQDLPQRDLVRALLEDIETMRLDKIRSNIKIMSEQSLSQDEALPAIDVSGIGALEVQLLRPFLKEAFRVHRALCSSVASQKYKKDNDTGITSGSSVDVNVGEQQKRAKMIRPARNVEVDSDGRIASTPVYDDDEDEDLIEPRPLEEDGFYDAADDNAVSRPNRLRRHR